MDDVNGVQFAKNIMNVTKEEVIRQSACYVRESTEVFLEKSHNAVDRGYGRSFSFCADEIWHELCAFASKSNEVCRADCVSEYNSLVPWTSDLVNGFA